MILFGFYEGSSTLSRIIKWETRSDISHVSVMRVSNHVYDPASNTIRWHALHRELQTCSLWEAWGKSGIVRRTGIHEAHTPGTPIHILRYAIPVAGVGDPGRSRINETAAVEFMNQCVAEGVKYDWWGLVRFLIRINKNNPRRMFCSEFAHLVSAHAGQPLLERIKGPHFVAPADQYHTPILAHLITVKTGAKP